MLVTSKINPSKPLITIIVAVFNGAQTLQRCLDSVRGQSYENIQLIVMDGGSIDGTVDILNANNDIISYWESRSDRGIYHAWNKALNYAAGEWVCFLGADDYLWKVNVLEKMAFNINAGCLGNKIIYGKVALVSRDNDKVIKIIGAAWSVCKEEFMRKMTLPHPGVMHHRTLFESRGRFDESFKIAGDYEFLLRELKSENADFINDVIVVGMQVGGLSYSFKNVGKTIKETELALVKNDLPFNWIYSKARMLNSYLNIIIYSLKKMYFK